MVPLVALTLHIGDGDSPCLTDMYNMPEHSPCHPLESYANGSYV